LFGLACCQRIQHLITDPRSLTALEVAARQAEGLAAAGELDAVFDAAFDVGAELEERADESLNALMYAAMAAEEACHPQELCESVAQLTARAAEADGIPSEIPTLVALVRDIFGNPFRPVAFAPEWRTDTAVAIARQMYESRDFGAMPILADALQDAGCDNADVLNHCRGAAGGGSGEPVGGSTASGGTHVRGCWVVDLVLGKQ
jgi:hypothetical protein